MVEERRKRGKRAAHNRRGLAFFGDGQCGKKRSNCCFRTGRRGKRKGVGRAPRQGLMGGMTGLH